MADEVQHLKDAVARLQASEDRHVADDEKIMADLAAVRQQLADAIAANDPAAIQAAATALGALADSMDAESIKEEGPTG